MKFIEDIHKYIDEECEYTPVTYFIKSFEPYKDWNEIAAKYAKKNKRTVESVLKEWEDNKNTAAIKGTKFHNIQEQRLLNEGGVTIDNTFCAVSHVPTLNGIKEDLDTKLENNKVYPEKMIWSRKYKVCGTADIVRVSGGKIYIEDYKTNKKLDYESYDHFLKGKEKLKRPVAHLDNCNFNIYQLQLNLYMFMLLQQNRHLKMGTMTILHIKFDENDQPESITNIPVSDLQKEVKEMLEYFINTK